MDITHDWSTISPFDIPSGVTASMTRFAPNHSDIVSAKYGSTCLVVFQALAIWILVYMVSQHGIFDLLIEILRQTCEWCFLFPISCHFLVFLICLSYDLIPNFWGLLLPTGPHVLISHLESFERHHGNFYGFPKWVKGCLDLFLVEFAIYHDSSFLSGVCHSCWHYVLDDAINIGLVGTPSQVLVPAAKLLKNEVVSFYIKFMQ